MTSILFPELSAGLVGGQEFAATRNRGDQDGAQLSFADFLRMMGALPSLEVATDSAAVVTPPTLVTRVVNAENLQTSHAQSAMWLEGGFRELMQIAYGDPSATESATNSDPILNSPYMAKLFSDANAEDVLRIPLAADAPSRNALGAEFTDGTARNGVGSTNEVAQSAGAYLAFLSGEAKTESWTQFRLSSPDVDPMSLARDPYVVEQVADPIVNWAQLSKDGEQTQFHVRLDPPELGAVRLVVTASDDAISVQMVTASDATRDVMQTHLADLVQALEAAGLNLEECDVTCDESFAHTDPPLPVDDPELRSDAMLTESFRDFLDNPGVLNADRIDIVV